MSDQEQLAWERANAPRFAAAAVLASLLVLVGFVLPIVIAGGRPGNEREALLRIDENANALLASAALQGVAYIALAGVFIYLLKLTKARRPETPAFLWPIVYAAPVLLVVGLIYTQFTVADVANTFVNSSNRSADYAEQLVKDQGPAPRIIASLGTLLLALSFVLTCVNGMRAGLFSRFMGIVGGIAGALLVLPLVPGAIIQSFWIAAVAVLLLDRWPNGRGPAWDAVEPIPWPSATAEAKGGEAPPEAPPPAEEPAGAGAGARPAAARKRKKKKRR